MGLDARGGVDGEAFDGVEGRGCGLHGAASVAPLESVARVLGLLRVAVERAIAGGEVGREFGRGPWLIREVLEKFEPSCRLGRGAGRHARRRIAPSRQEARRRARGAKRGLIRCGRSRALVP